MASNSYLVEHAMRACGNDCAILSINLIAGAGSQQVHQAKLNDGTAYIIKTVPQHLRDRLDSEADGLNALRQSERLLVPRTCPIVETDDHACLVMQAFETSHAREESAWVAFGRSLAEHHASCTETQYGWHRDNYIGATSQPNTRCKDWVTFNAEYRIGFQVSLARKAGLLSSEDEDRLGQLIDRLGSLIPSTPKPALLHGDLWSGNALCTLIDGEPRIAVIDPAVYVGDGWADIAMMMMFGGFPPACFDAYRSKCEDHETIEERVLVYQLYHMLNHLNLFGGGYHSSVMSIATQLERL